MKWLMGLIACTGVLFVISSSVGADSYNVNAVVPYDAPTVAAAITLPVNNFETNSASINVSGTCEYVAPGTVVVVTRNASIAGSSACSVGGTFNLVIALTSGPNQLVARTANLNSLYGPDSTLITVLYSILPEPPELPFVPDVPDSRPQPDQVRPSLAALSDLVIKSDDPVHVIDDTKKTVSITLQVSGGETPYDLVINWGDGTVETRRIDASGSYTFTYEYSKPGTYSVVATVTDVKGTSRQYNLTVISPTPENNNNENSTTGSVNREVKGGGGWQWWYWLFWIIPLLVFCFALGMFVESRWIVGAKRQKRKKKK